MIPGSSTWLITGTNASAANDALRSGSRMTGFSAGRLMKPRKDPSGRGRLISVQPTWPPAPPLFTTRIGWPSCFSAIAATMRAATSVLPPAGKATMSCTGLTGYCCALAGPAPSASMAVSADASPCAIQCRFVFMVVSSSWLQVERGFESLRFSRFEGLQRRELQRRDDDDQRGADEQRSGDRSREEDAEVPAGDLQRSPQRLLHERCEDEGQHGRRQREAELA